MKLFAEVTLQIYTDFLVLHLDKRTKFCFKIRHRIHTAVPVSTMEFQTALAIRYLFAGGSRLLVEIAFITSIISDSLIGLSQLSSVQKC